jgi:MFS family permease
LATIRQALARTFKSLAVRNYRLFFFGQIVSMSGTWLQSTAQMWLVYQLTGSGVALGVVTALQFAPVLIGGLWGGVIADRFDKRKILMVAQSLMALLALILGLLVLFEVVQLWHVYLLAAVFGCVSVFEVPSRQSFVVEMVSERHVANAVGLNSTVFTSARVIGPAVAGVLIASVGIAWCFLLNAASFLAVISALALMDPDDLFRGEPVERRKGQLREGLLYVWRTPLLRTSLLMMALIGTIAFNFRVLLPVMAEQEFGGGAGTYGALLAVQGVGTVFGALFAAGRARPTRRLLIGAAFAYGVLILVAGIAPTLPLEMIALVPMGAAGIAFIATANSTLQLNSRIDMRGRVMALYSVVFLGSTPIGSPVVGWITETFGVRTGFLAGAVACFLAVAYALRVVQRERIARRGDVTPATVPGSNPSLDASSAVDDPEASPAASGIGGTPRRLAAALRFALRR